MPQSRKVRPPPTFTSCPRYTSLSWGYECDPAVEHLPTTRKALGSIPNTTHIKKSLFPDTQLRMSCSLQARSLRTHPPLTPPYHLVSAASLPVLLVLEFRWVRAEVSQVSSPGGPGVETKEISVNSQFCLSILCFQTHSRGLGIVNTSFSSWFPQI